MDGVGDSRALTGGAGWVLSSVQCPVSSVWVVHGVLQLLVPA